MLITTTSTIEGKQIKYLGLASGQVVAGVNIVKDIFAGFRNFFGGRTRSYEAEIEKAKEEALQEMTEKAKAMGANAVIAVDLDFEALGQGGTMLMVTATGTAVQLS